MYRYKTKYTKNLHLPIHQNARKPIYIYIYIYMFRLVINLGNPLFIHDKCVRPTQGSNCM